ncbi:MAG: hypothetical protein LBE31_01740 [Deltaproteobacteria bacterium]|jgi:hypothetical protein|nr:hypothetical protein [Deltaproteobacteria bacterium]
MSELSISQKPTSITTSELTPSAQTSGVSKAKSFQKPLESGKARQAEAQRAPSLPNAEQRQILKAKFDQDQVNLEALFPKVGPQAYAIAKASNILDGQRAGIIDQDSALKGLRECRSFLPNDEESGASGLTHLDNIERIIISSPLKSLAGLSQESGLSDSAMRFNSLARELNNDMEALKAATDSQSIKKAYDKLLVLQGKVLSDDSLYKGLPNDAVNTLQAALSVSMQSLLQSSLSKLSLAQTAPMVQKEVEFANALTRSALMATSGEFDVDSIRSILGPALEAASGVDFSREQSILNTDPLTERQALDLLHDLKERAVSEGVIEDNLSARAENLRQKALEASDSQFSRGVASPGSFYLNSPESEPAQLTKASFDAQVNLKIDPTNSLAEETLRKISNDLDLLGIAPLKFNEDTLTVCASMRGLKAQWSTGAINTDTLAQSAALGQAHLTTMGDGPEKNLLKAEIDSFDSFRSEVESDLSSGLQAVLSDPDNVLGGSPTPEDIKKFDQNLEGAFVRLTKDPRVGENLKDAMAAKTSDAKSKSELKLIDVNLQILKGPKAVPLSLGEILANHQNNPQAVTLINNFSHERLSDLVNDIAQLKIQSDSVYAGSNVKAALTRLESKIDRLLVPQDALAAKTALSARREELRSELGARAKDRVDGRILDSLTPNEQANLQRALGAAYGSEALVKIIDSGVSGSSVDPKIAKSLASLADSSADISQIVDDILLSRPDLDEAALDVKLSFASDDAKDDVISNHNDARLRRQSIALLKDNGGQDILDSLGIKNPLDLTFSHLMTMVNNTVTTGDSPIYQASNFNTLLIQTAWSAYNQENNLSGSESDLIAFKSKLPSPLSEADPVVLRGLFALGPLSGAALSQVARLVSSGGLFVSAGDVGRLMDRMADQNPALKATRALTVMLRNMLTSAGIEYNSADDSAGAYAKALKAGLAKRAEKPSLADRTRDVARRALGMASDISGLHFTEQIDASLQRVQELSGSMDTIRQLEAEVAKAAKIVDEELSLYAPSDWSSLNFTPKQKFSEDKTVRLQEMTDAWRCLRHQGVLNVETQTIDHANIKGEKVCMTVLAFKDVLNGDVEGLNTPQSQLLVLKELAIPSGINFLQMRESGFFRPQEPEAKTFVENLVKLRQLNSADTKFIQDFNELKDLILADIEKYNLDGKAQLILALKDSREGLRHRENGGVTSQSAFHGVVAHGDTALHAAGSLVLENVAGTSATVSAAEALNHGLTKINLTNKLTNGNPLYRLRHHFLTGQTLGLRARAVNLDEASRRTIFDVRASYDRKKTVLNEALANLSSKTGRILEEATRMSTLSAFAALGYQDFAQAEADLRDANQASNLRTSIENNLVDNFGLDRALAGFLVEAHVIQPLTAERVSFQDSDGPGVLERFTTEAMPSTSVDRLGRGIFSQLAEPVRQLVASETNRRRFASILDQLEPNSAMDFSTGIKTSIKVGTSVPEVIKVSVAIEVAMEKGLALARDASGVYQLAIRAGFSGGVGVGASVLEGAIEASIGLKLTASQCLILDFKSQEDAASFLQKMSDKTFSQEDLFRHCQALKTGDSVTGGIAATGEFELGKVKIMDNSIIGSALFKAGFEASGSLERTTENDVNAQTISTTTTLKGSLGVSLSVGKAPEEDEEEEEDSDYGAQDIIESASAGSLEINDDSLKVIGKKVVINASINREEDGALKVSASVSAATSSTVTRSTNSDTRGLLTGASRNTNVQFDGNNAQTKFKSFAENNLGLDPLLVQTMLNDIQANDGPFTLEVVSELSPSAIEECRNLEVAADSGYHSETRKIMGNEDNYDLSSVKLVFTGRSDSLEGPSIDIDLAGLLQIGVKREAAASETMAVEYKAENGPLKAANPNLT